MESPDQGATTSSTNSLLVPNSNGNGSKTSMLSPNGVVQQGQRQQQIKPPASGGGSATGNPRNKCALKPGHSLMDWIRLGNSGVDLAGTKGRVMPVSPEELAKHNSQTDAWMAIRGNVYNVSRYMDFHPGGVDELMRGVGQDATKLFESVHAWVNYQQLLAKCYIGPLRKVAKLDADSFKSIKACIKEKNLLPPVPVSGPVEIVPRFDWIQKRSDLTLYFYTRSLCNPGLLLQHKNALELRLQVYIDHVVHLLEFQLHQPVKWPPQLVRIGSETGKIELQLKKATADELWPSYGSHTSSKITIDEATAEDKEFRICHKQAINHDSFELCLAAENTVMLLPIGYHVTLSALISKELTQRSYTPISPKYLASTPNDSTNLGFLIKHYKEGVLSSHLQQLQEGQSVLVSAPKGNFKLKLLQQHKHFALLAAGSGLTPFVQLIEHLLQRSGCKVESLWLYYFNKTEADIWCHKRLQHLQQSDERFHLKFILSQASDGWSGPKGHISQELMASIVDPKAEEYATYAAICGPNAFNQKSLEILKELKFKEENIHVFQG